MKRKPQNVICNPLEQLRNALVILTFVALSACATAPQPQAIQGSASGAARFNAADANHDEKLSRNEASDFLVDEIFSARDANHDGKMTVEEWTAGDPSLMPDFKKRDADQDGIVTKKEAIAYGRARGVVNQILEEADTDRDGYLQRGEVTAYYASREGPAR